MKWSIVNGAPVVVIRWPRKQEHGAKALVVDAAGGRPRWEYLDNLIATPIVKR